MTRNTAEARYEERYVIRVSRLNSDGKVHDLLWNYGGRGFTKDEAQNIVRCRLEKDARVKGYNIVRMKDSIITRIR